MTVADIVLTTVVDSALRRAIAVPEFFVRYLRQMIERPAYRDAFERNYTDRPLDPTG